MDRAYCNILDTLRCLQEEFQKFLYPYKQSLSGLLVVINPNQYNLPAIKSYLVLDQQGNQVQISFRLLSTGGIIITSNIDMAGLTIYLS